MYMHNSAGVGSGGGAHLALTIVRLPQPALLGDRIVEQLVALCRGHGNRLFIRSVNTTVDTANAGSQRNGQQ